MRSYLVELYQAAGSATEPSGVERARAAAEQLASDGTEVRYVRSIFIPVDEVCFHLFEGTSAEAVGRVSRRAEFDYARIVEVFV
jgi:hypothetical protein